MIGRLSSLHRFIPIVVVVAFLCAIACAAYNRLDARVLAGSLSVTQLPTGVAMVQVPYRRDGLRERMQVAVDENADGIFTDDEVVLRDIPVTPEKYWNANVFFRPVRRLTDTIRVRVAVGEEVVTRSVRVTQSRDEIAATEFSDALRPRDALLSSRMPDMPGGVGECGPMTLANAVTLLAKVHGEDGRLPSDAAVTLDELKTEMRWTRSDGVYPEDVILGANRWSQKKGLPIRTTSVDARHGMDALDVLLGAIASGGAAELRLLFSVPNGKTMRVIGGHLVTLVDVTRVDGRVYITVHDSRSPTGADIYEVRNGVIDYAFFSGTTALNGGFIQTWMNAHE